jgi:hypothetical protein
MMWYVMVDKVGYKEDRTWAAPSKAEAERLAQWLREMGLSARAVDPTNWKDEPIRIE